MNTNSTNPSPFILDFGNSEVFSQNGVIYDGTYDTNGDYEFVRATDGTECMRLKYSPTDPSMDDYRILFSFKDPAAFSERFKFVRLKYMTNSTSAMTVTLRNNCRHESAVLVKNTAEFCGIWHHSDVLDISDSDFLKRFLIGKYNGIQFNGGDENAEIFIKELAFFESRDAAYTYYGESVTEAVPFGETDRCTLTVGESDISKYRIVIDRDISEIAMCGIGKLVDHIKRLTGVAVPIVSDREEESEHEILIGKSDRDLSVYGLDGTDGFRRYAVSVVGSKLIITAANGFGVRSAIDRFLDVCLYRELVNVPDRIVLDESCGFTGFSDLMARKAPRKLPENVPSPQVFTEDFACDRGYFSEEANGHIWQYRDGCLCADALSKSTAYLHIYETNVSVTADFGFDRVGRNGDMAIKLRCTSEDGYLKAGYDFYHGEWYIDCREGNDFYNFRLASVKAEIEQGRNYTVNFTADGRNASLALDGGELLSVTDLTHITAGRIALFVCDASVAVDSFAAVFLSGEGKIIKSTVHTILPTSCVGNGASFFELSDGTVHVHVPQYGSAAFASDDGGATWYKTDAAVGEKGKYANILRLSDGAFIGIFVVGEGDERRIVSRISEDDGKTWHDRGTVCGGYYKDTKAIAGNMNDKLTESPTTGRVFYCQNYQSARGIGVDGRVVFCEFYYTDDKGKTWHKSLTDSWEIEGNEDMRYFGECKILECDDGVLRVYCSWSRHGCIVYSESTDGGVTWGPLQRIEELVTPCSSMQFCRDPYGETDTTYYMIWINNEISGNPTMPRSRLSLAKTTDGKNWEYLGDIWRCESAYLHHASKGDLNQIVNTTVGVCRERILVGSGISEKLQPERFSYHGYQQQHIWAIDRKSFNKSEEGK